MSLSKREIELLERLEASGFESLKQQLDMIAALDLSSVEKRDAFERWALDDGSKAGLEKLARLD